ncbi:MAG: hypothetical protein ACP5UQ_16820 [Anaerolineae bacterium]
MAEELHRRRHERRRRLTLPPFIRSYWVEILIVIGLALGIFLLFERIQIRATLLRWLRAALGAGTSTLNRLIDALIYFFTHIGLSELIAIPLLIVVVWALVWRVRWRAQHNPALTDLHCPRCGGNIHRVHRHMADRLISIIVPVRRYHCTNRECGWSGIRVSTRTHRARGHASPE